MRITDATKWFWIGLAIGLAIGAGVVLLFVFLTREGREAAPPAAVHPPPATPRPSVEPARPDAVRAKKKRATREEARPILGRRDTRDAQILEGEIASLRRQLAAYQEPDDTTMPPMAAENRILRDEIEKLRSALRREKDARAAEESSPIEFPRDLPERYRQEAMLKAVSEAIRAAGVPGEVRSVDCNEYPCIVYGDARVHSPGELHTYFRRAEEQLRRDYPAASSAMRTSLFSSRPQEGEETTALFGIAIYPKAESEAERAQENEMRKRMRYRQVHGPRAPAARTMTTSPPPASER
jgi:hypothetical protein